MLDESEFRWIYLTIWKVRYRFMLNVNTLLGVVFYTHNKHTITKIPKNSWNDLEKNKSYRKII